MMPARCMSLPEGALLIAVDVTEVLIVSLGEGVPAVPGRDEEEVVGLRRPDHRRYRVDAGVRDRARREARLHVRIIGRVVLEVLEGQGALPVAELHDTARTLRQRVL